MLFFLAFYFFFFSPIHPTLCLLLKESVLFSQNSIFCSTATSSDQRGNNQSEKNLQGLGTPGKTIYSRSQKDKLRLQYLLFFIEIQQAPLPVLVLFWLQEYIAGLRQTFTTAAGDHSKLPLCPQQERCLPSGIRGLDDQQTGSFPFKNVFPYEDKRRRDVKIKSSFSIECLHFISFLSAIVFNKRF